ncbi:hypothetical protein B0J14DRAFT_566016 [Halenospora varia]|nr:hypothetical protein B0J14DRAFT_566016 [Halenospora varia]
MPCCCIACIHAATVTPFALLEIPPLSLFPLSQRARRLHLMLERVWYSVSSPCASLCTSLEEERSPSDAFKFQPVRSWPFSPNSLTMQAVPQTHLVTTHFGQKRALTGPDMARLSGLAPNPCATPALPPSDRPLLARRVIAHVDCRPKNQTVGIVAMRNAVNGSITLRPRTLLSPQLKHTCCMCAEILLGSRWLLPLSAAAAGRPPFLSDSTPVLFRTLPGHRRTPPSLSAFGPPPALCGPPARRCPTPTVDRFQR